MKNLIGKHKGQLEKSNYVRKASPTADYWFDFSYLKLTSYCKQFDDNFCIVLWGDKDVEGDFFAIPFSLLKSMFVESYLSQSTASRPKRWVGNIRFNQFHVSNCPFDVDIAIYYGNYSNLESLNEPLAISEEKEQYVIADDSQTDESMTNEYAIENRKIEIAARQKQSKFRKLILKNFGSACCITNISEADLLVASHIIPWAHRIDTRLDPANGLCLSALCDKLFDKGYISLDNDLHIIITDQVGELSKSIQQVLFDIHGNQIKLPTKHKLKTEYLSYHRNMFSHGWM